MTIKEKIEAFKEKYGSTIRADYMPSVIIGDLIINPQYKHSNGYAYTEFYRKIFVPYMLYDKDLDVSAIAIGTISTKKTGGNQREWSGEIYYIVNHEQKLLNEFGGDPYYFYGKKTYYYAKGFLNEFYGSWVTAENQLKLFLGENIKIGNSVRETKLYYFAEWFTHPKAKDAGDEIIKLGTVSNIVVDTSDIDGMSLGWQRAMKIIIETNDRYDIVRCFARQKELQRIYFDSETNKINIFHCVNGTWEKSTGTDKYTHYLMHKDLADESLENTKRLKYLKDMATNNMNSYKYSYWDATIGRCIDEEIKYIRLSVFSLIKILRYPILEKLYKAGYKNIYDQIDKAQPKADLQNMFGTYNNKSKTIHGALGLNKFQLDFIDRQIGEVKKNCHYKHSPTYILSSIKTVSDAINISDMDNKQFESIYTFVDGIVNAGNRYTNYYERGSVFWSETETFARNTAKLTTMANRVNKISKQIPNIYNIYNDMVHMYKNCKKDHLDVVNIDFDELKYYQDFVRYHDYYTNIYNTHQEEKRRNYDKAMKERHEKLIKQYEKIYKERKERYEYTNGDYVFKIPEKPQQELADEGRVLGHCVGGYSDRVLSGSTNIIFLREKLAPTIPFMTIEVNGGKVVQCHGSHNAWLGSSEKYQKAIPAVMNWLHEKNIKCSGNILTSKAMGYSSYGAGNIELPQVSFDIKEILI